MKYSQNANDFFTNMLNFYVFITLTWSLVYVKSKKKYSFLKICNLKQSIQET
jgi:hypothetical protein